MATLMSIQVLENSVRYARLMHYSILYFIHCNRSVFQLYVMFAYDALPCKKKAERETRPCYLCDDRVDKVSWTKKRVDKTS